MDEETRDLLERIKLTKIENDIKEIKGVIGYGASSFLLVGLSLWANGKQFVHREFLVVITVLFFCALMYVVTKWRNK